MDGLSSSSSSVPSSPVQRSKQMEIEAHNTMLHKSSSDQQQEQLRASKLDELREQLLAARIPLSKRASVCEVPQSASDCQLIPGTTRCKLALCEDSCTEAHTHHHTHAKPLSANAPLVYSRPSITRGATGTLSQSLAQSPAESPVQSMAPSANTSPQQQYRRASHFGFGLGSHRGSIANVVSSLGAGASSIAHGGMASGPPSPFSDGALSSAQSSAANSPRQHHGQAPVMHEYIVPIMEEGNKQQQEQQQQQEEEQQAASANASAFASASAAAAAAPVPSAIPATSVAPSGPAAPGTLAPHLAALDAQYWRLRDRIVNLRDYAPGPAGVNTAESRSRMDLAAGPRDDFPDQSDASSFFDPRSPEPPAPVPRAMMEAMEPVTSAAGPGTTVGAGAGAGGESAGPGAQIVAVNINEVDRSKPEIQYVLKPTGQQQ